MYAMMMRSLVKFKMTDFDRFVYVPNWYVIPLVAFLLGIIIWLFEKKKSSK